MLELLADDLRRSLYELVVSRSSPVSRAEAARSLGISRTLAAYHLDRLVDAGLLEAHFERSPGLGGPGAGRPPKRYRRGARQVSVVLPARRYELAADLLAGAIAGSDAARRALLRAARETGAAIGRAGSTASSAPAAARRRLLRRLEDQGYEPVADGDAIRLRNCPFRQLISEHRDVICGMNLRLLEGLTEATAGGTYAARLDPDDEHCCVRLEQNAG